MIEHNNHSLFTLVMIIQKSFQPFISLIIGAHINKDWIPLTLLNSIDASKNCKSFEYRFTHDKISYLSPPTERLWSYDTYSEVPGIWGSSDGKTFECHGGEAYQTNDMAFRDPALPEATSARSFGIGCSNGPLDNFKVLPLSINDENLNTIDGTGLVCQHKPMLWGKPCVEASFSYRCIHKWILPSNINN